MQQKTNCTLNEARGPVVNDGAPDWSRRRLLKVLSAVGIGSAVFGRALLTLAAGRRRVTSRMLKQAEWISGMQLTEDKRQLMLKSLNDTLEDFQKLRDIEIDNGVPPALYFQPHTRNGTEMLSPRQGVAAPQSGSLSPQLTSKEVAFAPVSELSNQIQSGRISSVELTELYLKRLRRFDPTLECVINLCEDLAMRQAERADQEIAKGNYRGPLHGIPWGAKDLLAVPGYPTTWGAGPYRNQVRPEKATVVTKLEEAGGILLAKLSLGALAWGDVWFGGKTKNPWNIEQGSSGSSAGPAAATAAGLVGFAIGTETWGSIVSPCTRCGTTGLRPTFGRVSRYGAMALAWSMDKIGPIARSAEDCAIIFQAIHGADPRDPTSVDHPFNWPIARDPRTLRVGYVESLFQEDRTEFGQDEEAKTRLREWQEFDLQSLDVLRGLGIQLIPIKLPDRFPVEELSFILTAEASAAFDELTRSGKDDQLVRQIENAWPNVFRQGQMIPAVEYLRANRIRTLMMKEMEKVLSEVDVYVAPSFGGNNLLLTNLTGHPCVVLPNGFRKSDGTPTSMTFMGRLYGEAEPLALAQLYQQATDFHTRHPTLASAPSSRA